MNKSSVNRYVATQHFCLVLKRLLLRGLPCLVIAILAACQPQVEYFSKNPVCQHPLNTNDYCTFTLGEYNFWLSSDDPGMPIETGVTLYLNSQVDLQSVAAEVRGVSMYMGRTPVVGELTATNQWRGAMYLGACTDPQMIWSLHLAITTITGETYRHEIQFQSYIPTTT